MTVLTFFAAASVVTCTVIGASALPWTDREVAESRAAWEALFRLIVGVQPAPVLVELPADDLLPAPLPRPMHHPARSFPRSHIALRSALAR